MANINIDEEWFIDPRRQKLALLLGGSFQLADGLAVELWRMAQTHIKKTEFLGIPIPVFERIENSKFFIDVGLAAVDGDFIYLKGMGKHHKFVLDRIEAGRRGGLKTQEKKSSKLKQTQANRSKRNPSSSSSSSESNTTADAASHQNTGNGFTTSDDVDTRPRVASPTNLFIVKYVEAFQKRYGTQTRPDLSGRVLGQIKRLVTDNGLERSIKLIQRYFEIEDRWFQTKCYDFTTFIQNLQKVSLALDGVENIAGPKYRPLTEEDIACL